MMKFAAKVLVGGVGVYLVNQYLEKLKQTGVLEQALKAGTQVGKGLMAQVVAAAQAQQRTQQGGVQ